MANLAFSVGRKGEDSVSLTASLPPISKHPHDKKIPFSVKLPTGKMVSGEIDSPMDLILAQAAIQLQNATRDLLFPKPETNGTKRSGSKYQE